MICMYSETHIQILYNFRYSVVKVGSTEMEDCLQWLHDRLTSKRHAAGRMQNVCKSFCVQCCLINLSIVEMSAAVLPILCELCCRLKHIGQVYEHLSYHHGSNIVKMYYAKVPKSIQNEISAEFSDPQSKLCVVICSSSFFKGKCFLYGVQQSTQVLRRKPLKTVTG